MMTKSSLPPFDDFLAAEYVLGVLAHDENQRCEDEALYNDLFVRHIADWEERFLPLLGQVASIEPSASVFHRLEVRLFGESADQGTSVWGSVNLWRWVSAISLTMIVMFASWFIVGPERHLTPTLIATLQLDETPFRAVAVVDSGRQEIAIRTFGVTPGAQNDYELWLIEGSAAPISLGLVQRSGEPLRPRVELLGKLTAGATLAISYEPLGGSPTGAPTGPVLGVGVLDELSRT